MVKDTLPVLQSARPDPDAALTVELAFKGTRRGYYASRDTTFATDDYVVVAVERGHDLGRVRAVGGVAVRKCASCGSGAASEAVLRAARAHEVEQLHTVRADEPRVRRQAREIVKHHGLAMKVTDAEWQWDRNKLTLYFTAERRVDFRQLVRELARTFRARIDLKQIGVREEAALLGGVGRCGRELCCSTWLRAPKTVSLQLAKDQHLSLNPQQISGTCGRLMCCLTYEHDAYLQARKRFPREGKILKTSRGQEKVLAIDIWRERVTLLDESRERRVVALEELKRETDATRETGVKREPASPSEGTVSAGADAQPTTVQPRPRHGGRRNRRRNQPQPE
ncbi:hypothetical protein BH20GEM2_BH20GEM2_00430 [soil metagenome]